MGQDSILNEEQAIIFNKLSTQRYLKSSFYFTGGTALSEVYLKHRASIDLDFFTSNKFDPQIVFNSISGIAKELSLTLESQKIEETHIYVFNFTNGKKMKVDFAYYPYKRLKEGAIYKGFEVDSGLDIAVNKLLLIGSQRVEVKDFVDLYFLLNKFSIWDLLHGVKVKFNVKLEPYLLASDFLAVRNFEFLPQMIKPFSLLKLKNFYIDLSKSLSSGSIE